MKTRHLCLIAILAATVCAFVACGSDSTPSSPSAPASPGPDITINIVGINGANSFAPSPTTINAGQRVVWKNTDTTRSHDASADNGAFTTPILASGASSDPVTMNTRGTFTYKCTIHPSMVGTITVQ
jgi:plastocyanin